MVIDLSNYYQSKDSVRVKPEKFPERISAEFISPTIVQGNILMDGFPIYFYLELDKQTNEYGFFVNDEEIGKQAINVNQHSKITGLYFRFIDLPEKAVTTKIGFSFKSLEQAKSNLWSDIQKWDLTEVSANASSIWNQYLSKIEIKDSNTEKKKQFYSALYKAILKPANLQGENPFWETDNYMVDFATSWDIYSTQLPFVFTFYPEEGQKIAQFYIDLFYQFGRFPPAYLMKEGMPWVFSKQASALGNFFLADAYAKNISGIDWKQALDVMVKTVNNDRGLLFQQGIPLAPSPTHNQDYAYAAFCAGLVAHGIGEKEIADEMMRLSGLWKTVHDSKGILRKVDDTRDTKLYPRQHFSYYEGSKWNYTYRIWQDMAGLIKLQGGDEGFVKNLDWYNNLSPNRTKNQFQGLNNEVDYCSPYAYIYAGRPDRTQQILRIAMQYRFRNTRGGLPGNDDGGAMTSWYAWNSIGLFPITGQDIFMIGSPIFESIKVNGNKPFEIKTINNSDNNIFVQSAKLNGELLKRAFIYFKEFQNGGELELIMGDQPSDWGSKERPPSYSTMD